MVFDVDRIRDDVRASALGVREFDRAVGSLHDRTFPGRHDRQETDGDLGDHVIFRQDRLEDDVREIAGAQGLVICPATQRFLLLAAGLM